MKSLKLYFKPFVSLLYLYLAVCFLLRIIMLFDPIRSGHLGIGGLFRVFVLGAVSNALIFIQVGILLWIYYLFLSDGKYKKPYGYIIFGLLVALLIYVLFFNTILNEYGSVLPLLGALFIGIKTLLFGFMLFLPKYRHKVRVGVYSFCLFLFVSAILLNAVSEWGFFNEFGVRYNFIAVDYLIYTGEVIGNIMESYPVVPLFSVLGLVSLIITWLLLRKTKTAVLNLPNLKVKLLTAGIFIALVLLGWATIPALSKLENSPNVFDNEIQADGVYKFYEAYTHNELSYDKFYPTIASHKAFDLLKSKLPGIQGSSTERMIKDTASEIHKNVVLITVESLSADYMAHFGNKNKLTPFLDSLADQSLFFTHLIATGNRTVRGLEAVTLCIPPTPGESIIKRADNKNKFGIGYLFKQRGYSVKFMYGGYSYFDNMKDFYVGNGYEVVDRDNFNENEITFANVWGVCDEDMAKKIIQVMNQEAKQGKPFFNHWMTVSNHRPFTYPNDKISIPGDAKSRKGGVMYTDYALREFFKMAEKQPWFNNTVFIIVADHCSSSAGKTELPMDKYRIPAIVYGKGFIQPQQITQLTSQIDLMPTVLGRLHFTYNSRFYGQDALKPDYQPRAFMATYQDMGFVKDSILTIISPVKHVKQYKLALKPQENVLPQFQENYKEVPMKDKNQALIDETIAYYQTASWLLTHQGYQK